MTTYLEMEDHGPVEPPYRPPQRCKHQEPKWLVKPVPNIVGYVPTGWQWCPQCGATRMVHSVCDDGSAWCPGARYNWRFPKEARR